MIKSERQTNRQRIKRETDTNIETERQAEKDRSNRPKYGQVK